MSKYMKHCVDFGNAPCAVQGKEGLLHVPLRLGAWQQAFSCIMAGAALLSTAPVVLAQDLVTRDSVTQDLVEGLSAGPLVEPGLESATFFNALDPQNSSGMQQAQAKSDEEEGPLEETEDSLEETEELLQFEMTQDDQRVMEELIGIAVRNAPAVRDAQAEMGVAPFIDAFVVEIAPSRLSSTLTDASIPDIEGPYRTSDSSTTSTFTFNPIQLINGIQKIPALQSHLRDAQQQTRVAVIESYVAYVQARQSTAISTRQLNTVVASILEQSQVASVQLNPVPASSILENNEDYIAAATESLAANSDAIVALETLAATVGMPTQDMLTVIETTISQLNEGQPTVAVEKIPRSEDQPMPSVLLVGRDRD